METIELDNETTITNIGTLEWNMEHRTILPANLEAIRPTTEEDMKHVKIAAAQYALDVVRIQGEYNHRIRDALLYVAAHVLRVLLGEGMEEGPILLCFAKKQQRWDVIIQCNAYKASP